MIMQGFNPAEAGEGFRRWTHQQLTSPRLIVSIQPKPEKGLEDALVKSLLDSVTVSIQPKSEKGLEACVPQLAKKCLHVSIQPKPEKGLEADEEMVEYNKFLKFQSSRSRRRV